MLVKVSLCSHFMFRSMAVEFVRRSKTTSSHQFLSRSYLSLIFCLFVFLGFNLHFEASKFFSAADMAVDDITFPGCALPPIRACSSGEYRCTRGSCVSPNQVNNVSHLRRTHDTTPEEDKAHSLKQNRTEQNRTVRHRTVPHRTAPHRNATHRTALHRNTPQRNAPHHTAMHYIAWHGTARYDVYHHRTRLTEHKTSSHDIIRQYHTVLVSTQHSTTVCDFEGGVWACYELWVRRPL